jgi:hypothetical protein
VKTREEEDHQDHQDQEEVHPNHHANKELSKNVDHHQQTDQLLAELFS